MDSSCMDSQGLRDCRGLLLLQVLLQEDTWQDQLWGPHRELGGQ
jgi:hypothetical protein